MGVWGGDCVWGGVWWGWGSVWGWGCVQKGENVPGSLMSQQNACPVGVQAYRGEVTWWGSPHSMPYRWAAFLFFSSPEEENVCLESQGKPTHPVQVQQEANPGVVCGAVCVWQAFSLYSMERGWRKSSREKPRDGKAYQPRQVNRRPASASLLIHRNVPKSSMEEEEGEKVRGRSWWGCMHKQAESSSAKKNERHEKQPKQSTHIIIEERESPS